MNVKTLLKQNSKKSRALHSELLSEVSSRVSSRNEFLRVGTSSEKAQKTRSDPNFRKTAISETRENENFGKNNLTQGLKVKYRPWGI